MRILVVDDESLVRRSLCKAGKTLGHEMFQAEDGATGLEQWCLHDPELVFLDVLMPGLSGPEVLKEIGPERKARVILMSAYSADHNFETARAKGADMFLAKPFHDVFEVFKQAESLKE